MSAPSGSDIVLQATVWPVYIGVSNGHPGGEKLPAGEPFDNPDYARGQIRWTTHEDGSITGRARIYLPKGIWTHFVFCSGCHQPSMMGQVKMDQPVVFDRPGFMDVDPINNGDAKC